LLLFNVLLGAFQESRANTASMIAGAATTLAVAGIWGDSALWRFAPVLIHGAVEGPETKQPALLGRAGGPGEPGKLMVWAT